VTFNNSAFYCLFLLLLFSVLIFVHWQTFIIIAHIDAETSSIVRTMYTLL